MFVYLTDFTSVCLRNKGVVFINEAASKELKHFVFAGAVRPKQPEFYRLLRNYIPRKDGYLHLVLEASSSRKVL